MDSPLKALHMFLAGPNDVVSKIDYLKNLNEKRKALSKKFYEEARQNFDTSTPLHLYTYV